MKSITFEQSGIKINNSTTQRIAATGGIINIDFMSNMDCKVVIPPSASDWLSIAPTTRSMTAYAARIQVEANHTLYTRSATIKIMTTDNKLSVDFTVTQDVFNEFTATTPLSGGWIGNDAITLFAGNNKNRKFVYQGTNGAVSGIFTPATNTPGGLATETDAHYAVYPYDSKASITADGAITTTFASEQKYVSGSFERKNNIMVAVTDDINDSLLNFQQTAAIICVKLYGTDQTIKSISLTSRDGEALAGTATIKATGTNILSCTAKGAATVKLNGVNDITFGATKATATGFYFAVPAVALSQGYTIEVEGFYGGKQSITVDATKLEAGKTYTTVAELKISTDGIGGGIGGWGNGGENGGTAD